MNNYVKIYLNWTYFYYFSMLS